MLKNRVNWHVEQFVNHCYGRTAVAAAVTAAVVVAGVVVAGVVVSGVVFVVATVGNVR